MTYIECHQGIAHKLPKDPDDDEPAEDNKDAAADPKAGDKPADPKVGAGQRSKPADSRKNQPVP